METMPFYGLTVPKRSAISVQPQDFPEVYLSDTGIDFGVKIDRDTWVKLGRWLGGINTRSKMWLADWAAENDRRHWEYTDEDLAGITGLDVETVQNYRYVGRRVRKENRVEGLPISHYQAVASLADHEQTALLQRDRDEEWHRDMLRDAVKQVKDGIAPAMVTPLTPVESHARVTAETAAGELVDAVTGEILGDEPANGSRDPLMTSDSYEWYTPPGIAERIYTLLNGISLDPASCAEANTVVRAGHIFTLEDDGLSHDWFGSVYMNPPYGENIGLWVTKLAHEYQERRVYRAVAMLPNRTDTLWFKSLREFPRCHLWGRLRFWGPANDGNSATFPSVLVALGVDVDKFAEAFEDIGDIYTRYVRGK